MKIYVRFVEDGQPSLTLFVIYIVYATWKRSLLKNGKNNKDRSIEKLFIPCAEFHANSSQRSALPKITLT